MKDFVGNELAVGDIVAVTIKHYRGLVKAKIIKFSPQQITVEYLNTWNFGPAGHLENYRVYPNCVIKI